MAGRLAHFEIEADDVGRARAFYENVFGWRFEPWGPPNFFMIDQAASDGPVILGSLSGRREPLTGTGNRAFRCTIAVPDVDATAAAVAQHGGKVVMERFEIPTVGSLIHFEDTEGNVAGAMQYLPGH